MRPRNSMTVCAIERPRISRDGQTMIITVPISMRRTGGRKKVVTPPGATPWLPAPQPDNTITKALARAHRWQGMLEKKLFRSVRELAKAEKIDEVYLGRVLRLTLLAPAVTEELLSGRQPVELDLSRLLKPFPLNWEEQKTHFRV